MWWLSSRRPGYSYYQNIVFVSEFGIFFILCSLQSFMAIVAKEIPAKFWFLKMAYMHHNNYSENKFFSKNCHLVLGYCCQKSLVILPCHHKIRHHRLACKNLCPKGPTSNWKHNSVYRACLVPLRPVDVRCVYTQFVRTYEFHMICICTFSLALTHIFFCLSHTHTNRLYVNSCVCMYMHA